MIDEIEITMPNQHHLLANLTPLGLSNANEVFVPTSEPFGRISATIARGEAEAQPRPGILLVGRPLRSRIDRHAFLQRCLVDVPATAEGNVYLANLAYRIFVGGLVDDLQQPGGDFVLVHGSPL